MPIFTIATGDLRAIVDPVFCLPVTDDVGPGGVIGLAGTVCDPVLGIVPTAVMDNAENWTDDFGNDWFITAMHEIGHLLGLGHTYDTTPLTIMGDLGSQVNIPAPPTAPTPPTPPTPTPNPNPVGDFQIDVNFTDNSLTPSQQAAFQNAANRWAQIITADIPDINVPGVGLVDDVLIDANAPSIDGPGGTLGQAGPTFLRPGSNLPARGIMQFDSADLAVLEASGQLVDVILHEMGHVLGIGTLWQTFGLITGAGGPDPQYIGTGAVTEYNSIFGITSTSVPVENFGGPGTRDGHWRESVFDNELMTGFLNSGRANPLSRITAGALSDMGYTVDLNAADVYTPPFAPLEGEPEGLELGAMMNNFGIERVVLGANHLVSSSVTTSAAGTAQAQSVNIEDLRSIYTDTTIASVLAGNTSEFVTLPTNGYLGVAELVFPGDNDIVHLQNLYRPEGKDIDLFRFEIEETGLFTAETFAERQLESSMLDTTLTLYRDNRALGREVIARNDDYYSDDSYLEMELTPGVYFIAVTAKGNDQFNPEIEDSGFGGKTEGKYDLRLNFRPNVTDRLVDSTGVAFDGDLDGVPGGVHDFWFRAVDAASTIIVDKSYNPTIGGASNGSLARPYTNIPAALAAAQPGPNGTPGDAVRVVGNGGVLNADGEFDLTNIQPYQVGFDAINRPLADGAAIEVPQGVTLMIDAGAVFKMAESRIAVGSSAANIDRSASALQVLGVPRLIDSNGELVRDETGKLIAGSVYFTSYDDEDIGTDTNVSIAQTPTSGDWGGIVFRNDVDQADPSRFDYEAEGIFLNYVNQADLRYGGGSVFVNSVPQNIAPLQMTDARPTLTFNSITQSDIGAISANPDSFLESNFHDPKSQQGAPFTTDYSRIGPDIYGNTIVDNSINGLFIRIRTPAGNVLEKLTVPGRFDDFDITHVLQENLELLGQPGSRILPASAVANLAAVELLPRPGGSLVPGAYNYVMTLVNANGEESLPSVPTSTVAIPGAPGNATIRLSGLPLPTSDFVGRRLYRSESFGGGDYTLVAELGATATTFIDDGSSLGELLEVSGAAGLTARMDSRLRVDGGIVVKIDAARIQQGIDSQLIAEGSDSYQVVFTSLSDGRYGAGGTFDTRGGDSSIAPEPGDWSGIFAGHESSISLDHAVLAYGGGVSAIEGTFAGFNVLEIHQADARVANSMFEHNASGFGGQATVERLGRGSNASAAIFIRGAQPILVNNFIRDTVDPNSTYGLAPAININVNSLNKDAVTDWGRTTGAIDFYTEAMDNQGPLIRDNMLDGNVNGLLVRGGTLTTESVWDDTDITHVVINAINVADFHTYGGLRLESDASESLVVKLLGGDAGFSANGNPLEIADRIGGAIHIVGQPGFPVVLTSLADDSVGAGLRPDGSLQVDTNGDGSATSPSPGDWRSIRLGEYSHDRNVQIVVEQEPSEGDDFDFNSTADTSQLLGTLAERENASDDNLRLGFEIHGSINNPHDEDVYSFIATAGTEVWFDIDRTGHALDTAIDLIDGQGNVIASSDNSFIEDDPEAFGADSLIGDLARPLVASEFVPRDYYGMNPLDAGMRIILPEPAGTNTYHLRVRSAAGKTEGTYQLQIRLRDTDEQPGSSIRRSDIRYATNAIELIGLPVHSPLVGEIAEVEGPLASGANNTLGTAQNIGNVLSSDRDAVSVSGYLGTINDIDWYRFEVAIEATQFPPGVPLPEFESFVFDLDYSDGLARADARISIFDSAGRLMYTSDNSQLPEDQPEPLSGAGLDDFGAGSVGALDPIIGPVELKEGDYYVAVHSVRTIPSEILTNSLLRTEPLTSIGRISENHFTPDYFTTAEVPQIDILFDEESVVPLNLSDVILFVAEDSGQEETRISTVDPFSGYHETTVGVFGRDVGDIAIRHNGNLHAFTLDLEDNNGPSDAESGNYLLINTGTAAATNLGDDGIDTYEEDPQNAGMSILANDIGNNNRVGAGIQFNALSYGIVNNAWRGFAVGDRGVRSPSIDDEFEENILYQFNPNNGQAFSATAMDRGTGPPDTLLNGAATDIVERGILDTFFDAVPPTANIFDALNFPPATNVDGFGFAVPGLSILDETSFSLVASDGTSYLFEFNSGPDFILSTAPNSLNSVRDGETFTVDGTLYEFDTGSVLVNNAMNGGMNITEGSTITITDNNAMQRVTVTFEFDSDGMLVTPGATAINYMPADNQNQITTAIVNAINGAGFGVTAVPTGTRITLLNESTIAADVAVSTDGNIVVQGAPDVTMGIRVPAEESFTELELGASIDLSLGVLASAAGDRLNFPGSLVVDFSGVADPTIFTGLNDFNNIDQGDGIVTPGAIGIDFGAGDSAAQIATRVQFAMLANGLNPIVNGSVVSFDDGSLFTSADPPLQLGGAAPGGQVTGMAFVGNTRMFVVSDEGGLYEVLGYTSNGFATLDYINTAVDLVGMDFQGLQVGPDELDNGAFAQTLFAIEGDGMLHSFDLEGLLQPIFREGQSSIPSGAVGNVVGFAFSNLDYNLWHASLSRRADAGHGVDVPPDESRGAEDRAGNSSFWFGFESPQANNVAGNLLDPGNRGDFDFPGGASGTIESNKFSLAGYAATDQPKLYFNYFLETDGGQGDLPAVTPFMTDSFRVFISEDDGEWQLMATNNSFRGLIDEYDYSPFGVQELFDNTGGWLQAEINLGPYAGRDNLQLRFDFSTAGSMGTTPDPNALTGLGNPFNLPAGGDELRTISGGALRDAQIFTVGNGTTGLLENFEIDLGYTIVAPTGATIQDGELLTVTNSIGQTATFEFDKDGLVRTDSLTAFAGDQIFDGQTFLIDDGVGNSATFEFDSGYTIQVPIEGGGDGGVRDGDTFVINDGRGGTDIVFEFNKDGRITPGNRIIQISDLTSQTALAALIANAINNTTSLGLTPTVLFGGQVHIGGVTQTLDTSGTPSLTVIGEPGPNEAGAVPIYYVPSDTFTPDDMAIAIADAINRSNLSLQALAIGDQVDIRRAQATLAAGDTILRHVDNDFIAVDGSQIEEGQTFTIDDQISPTPTIFEFDSGYVLQIPSAGGGINGVDEGDRIIINDGVGGDDFIIEFTKDVDAGNNPLTVQPDSDVIIAITNTTTQATIAAQVTNAIGAAGIGLAPTNLGGGTIHLGGTTHTVDVSEAPNVSVSGQPGAQTPGAVPIIFLPTVNFTAVDVANSIVTSINAAGLNVQATGDDEVVRLSELSVNFDPGTTVFTFAPNTIRSSDGSQFVEGDTFTLGDGINPDVVFELDTGYIINVPTQGGDSGGIRDKDTFVLSDNQAIGPIVFEFSYDAIVSAGRQIIQFSKFSTQNELADLIANAVAVRFGLDTRNLGNGQVYIGGTTHTLDVSATPSLSLAGQPDAQTAGAIPIPFKPFSEFSADQMASAVATAINSAGFNFRAIATGRNVDLVTTVALFSAGNTRLELENSDIQAFDGSRFTEGQTFTLDDGISGQPVLFEMDSGFVMQLPDAGPSGIRDGDRFSINDGQGHVVLFQFSYGAQTPVGTTRVLISASSTANQIATAIANAVAGTNLDLTATNIGSGSVHLGGEVGASVNVVGSPNVLVTGQPGAQTTGAIPVPFVPYEFFTADEMATALAEAINASPLHIQASGVGSVVHLAEVDATIFVGDTGINPSSIGILYQDTDTAEEIAGKISAAINNVRFLGNADIIVTADLSDDPMSNDTNNTAVDTMLSGASTFVFQSSGTIGDNLNLIVDPGLDVDVLSVVASPGDIIEIDIDADVNGSTLDSIVRLFDFLGNEVAINDDDGNSLDSFLSYLVPDTAAPDSTYFIGISGWDNDLYDIGTEGSGLFGGSTGDYDVSVRINSSLGGLATHVIGNRVNLENVTDISQTAAAGLVIEGAPGTTNGRPVVIHSEMTDEEVALVIQQALADAFSNGELEAFPVDKEVVRIVGSQVTDPGPLGLAITDLLIPMNGLDGDEFGAFYASTNLDGSRDPAFPGALRGQANNFEGAYVDDIYIGFAERGEMLVNANPNPGFTILTGVTDPPNILEGPYQLEIRRSQDFGITSLLPPLALFDTFDTNDRLNQSFALIAPNGYAVSEGETFMLGDGVTTLTFEYDDLAVDDGVADGHIRIPFDVNDTDIEMARRIRDLINSDPIQALIDVTAGLSDGTVTGTRSTSVLINLYGDNVVPEVNLGLDVTEVTEDANQLRDFILGPGVTPVGNARFTGSATSAGFFTSGRSTIGINEGIILTTGNAFFAEGPNTDDASTGTASQRPDAELDALFGVPTADTTALEFDFELSEANDLFFNFVFASEEYNEFANGVFNDVFAFFLDGENLALIPGTKDFVSINNVNGGNPFGTGAVNPELFRNNDIDDDGEFLDLFGYDGFTQVFTAQRRSLTPGVHTIRLVISDVGDTALDSAVFIEASSFGASLEVEPRTGISGIKYEMKGDENRFRDQGQVIIEANQISNVSGFGIVVDAATRQGPDNRPHTGAPRTLSRVNVDGLVPGVTITNNVIFSSGGGVRFSGDANAGNVPTAAVPFGRIINNTIYGTGIGIDIADNASPTLLNNIVAASTTGIQVDNSSALAGTILGGNLFQDNGVNSTVGVGDFAITLAAGDPLFVNPAAGNFYLAPQSRAIDSAIDSLQDREELVNVKSPVGIAPSPILAPKFDYLGQLRTDDRTFVSPDGSGEDVFKDRGAIDRADFTGPSAELLKPLDNDAERRDQDPTATNVLVLGDPLSEFAIQLVDGVLSADQSTGTAIDLTTVDARSVRISRTHEDTLETEELQIGIDYIFNFDQTNNTIRLTPLPGIWLTGYTYTIRLANMDGFVINSPAGDKIVDGDGFRIGTSAGDIVEFEFDSGFVLHVPAEGKRTGGIRDGDTFSIRLSQNDPQTVFQFFTTSVPSGSNVAVDIRAAETPEEIGEILAAAIASVASLQLNAVHYGDGVVSLGGDEHVLNVSGTRSLTVTGRPGLEDDTAIPIFFAPSAGFSASDVSLSIAMAINGSDPEELTGSAQGPVVALTGASFVTGVDTTFQTGIKDVAGNLLRPNQINGDTRFQIAFPSGLDFGDAPSSYGTRRLDDGARHALVEGFYLGAGVDGEDDGQPSAMARGDDNNQLDDEDGVSFESFLDVGTETTITITASDDGFLDAFIDYNNDGDFFDDGEQIASGLAVSQGVNELTVLLPPTAVLNTTTYARFRFSSFSQGLGPIGPAPDGEVEDYAITIGGNPWQNSVDPLDVNADGMVDTRDISSITDELFVRQYSNAFTGALPMPPAAPFIPTADPGGPHFVDVNGDGRLTLVDAALIYDHLREREAGVILPPPPLASLASSSSAPKQAAVYETTSVDTAADVSPAFASFDASLFAASSVDVDAQATFDNLDESGVVEYSARAEATRIESRAAVDHDQALANLSADDYDWLAADIAEGELSDEGMTSEDRIFANGEW
ncbi:MAG: choice-of-anchor L domain-containing protein [Planctomycetales bacterium]|nr:choice-of-anchor L domain-containing protein [Planctomycetales bacterium]